MLLAVDIGNTTITCGLFRKNKLVKRFSFFTKQAKYYASLKKYISGHTLDGVIISSVVPGATTRLEIALRFLKANDVFILGKNLFVPIRNLYQYPKQVGQDRLVNAYAAAKLYGYPAIVVDSGTAVTFDVISARGEYLGGMILPGIEISLAALAQNTALLPRVKISRPPKNLIGKNTRNSILSGIVYGFASLTDGLLEKLGMRLGKKTKIVGTGGNIRFISQYCKRFDVIDMDLTLKGLNLIFHTRL